MISGSFSFTWFRQVPIVSWCCHKRIGLIWAMGLDPSFVWFCYKGDYTGWLSFSIAFTMIARVNVRWGILQEFGRVFCDCGKHLQAVTANERFSCRIHIQDFPPTLDRFHCHNPIRFNLPIGLPIDPLIVFPSSPPLVEVEHGNPQEFLPTSRFSI